MKVKEKRNRKKIFVRCFLILCGLILIVLGLGLVLFPKAELPEMVSKDVCDSYNIRFDTTSIEQIYHQPERILANPDQFLQNDTAYLMFTQHRTRVNDPFSYQAWLKDIEKLAAQSEESRLQKTPYRLYELIMTYQQSFCQEIVENVLTYLPEGTELDVTVYLTAHEGSAAAYTRPGEIAFSLSSPLFVNTAFVHETTGLSAFFNLALHEFFHLGFAENLDHLSKEEHRKNEIVIDLLSVLQNEGIATHISHRMNPKYPTPFEWFIYLIDNETIVRWFIGELNEILADGSPPPPLGEAYNQIYRRIGKVGYRWNGLYIVGGYMALTIEDQLGREALVQTVQDGFYSFSETYNTLAPENMKIVWELIP